MTYGLIFQKQSTVLSASVLSKVCIHLVNLMLWIKSTELKKGASDCYERQSNFQDEHDQCACA